MAASLLSVAAASSSSSSSSSLLHPSSTISNLSIDPDNSCSPFRIRITHYSSKLRPKSLILNRKVSNFPFASIRAPASAAIDNLEVKEETENTELQESEVQDYNEREEEEEEVQKKSQSSENGRLFVGSLPYAITSSQLVEIFGEAGRVLSVEIIYDRITDRSRGFGFVTMGSVEEAKEAIRLFDGSQIGGRTVKVNFPEVPRGGEREVMGPKIRSSYQGFIDSPHKIYAGNLSWNLNSQKLKDAFADHPGLLSAKVIYEKHSGRSRGFGFVSFASAEEAESALSAMNGVEIEGRPLRLNLATEKASLASPPSVEPKVENILDSSELLSSIGA